MSALVPSELLRELVAIPSVSGAEGELAAFVHELLRARAIDVARLAPQDGTVLARIARGRGPRLSLNSHLDTVPVGSGWSRDPFAAVWDGDKLFGRGANDAKASAAALLCAFVALAEDASWRGEIALALTACEETTNAGMAAVLEHAGRPDASITGEPTGLEVVRAQGGLAVLVAQWTGRSCHAAHVARVAHENALLAAASDLVHVAPWLELDGEHPLLGKSTIAATVLRAGERHNVVPDSAEALFDARLAPPHDADAATSLLSRKLPHARVSVRSARLRPIETAADHPLVVAALACAGKSAALGSTTLSDMALLQGVPSVKCGPGLSARSHTPDEFVLRSEVDAGFEFYLRVAPRALDALAGAPRSLVSKP